MPLHSIGPSLIPSSIYATYPWAFQGVIPDCKARNKTWAQQICPRRFLSCCTPQKRWHLENGIKRNSCNILKYRQAFTKHLKTCVSISKRETEMANRAVCQMAQLWKTQLHLSLWALLHHLLQNPRIRNGYSEGDHNSNFIPHCTSPSDTVQYL